MNLRILIAVLWLFSIELNAQIVFCSPGAVWTSVFTKSWPDQTPEIETAQYTGTVIVGGEIVKEVSHRRFFLRTNFKKIESSYIKQVGDTIFVKNSRTSNTWQILYNFGGQIGDKWYNNLIHGSTNINYTTTINSIQNITYNGFILKQLTVLQLNNNGAPNNYTYTITERLGSNLFLFPFGGKSVSDGDMLIKNLCYSDNTFGSYYYNGVDCNYPWVGEEELKMQNERLRVFPSPASQILNIGFPAQTAVENTKLIILDAFGKEVYKTKELSQNFKIDISSFSKGIYFFQIMDEAHLIDTRKIIIE